MHKDSAHGVVAQLGERLNGIQEVVGSIPISSTNFLLVIRHPLAPKLARATALSGLS